VGQVATDSVNSLLILITLASRRSFRLDFQVVKHTLLLTLVTSGV